MSFFAIQHPDGRYWSVSADNKVVLSSFPTTYEFHDEKHIRNTGTGMCVRHSYWVLVESQHDNVPGDFEWTIQEDGQITSSFDGGHNVIVDGDDLKIANDGSTVFWKIVYKNNRFCLCPTIEKCTCNGPTTPIFTQPPEEILGVEEPIDVMKHEFQTAFPVEIVQKLTPPEFIIPEAMEKLASTSEPTPEVPAPAPESTPEAPAPVSEPTVPEPAPETPAPVPEPEAPSETPTQSEN